MEFESENKQFPPDSQTPSLYEVLGVPNTATTQQITKCFRRRAVKQHPDKGGDPKRYGILTQAYEILKNPEKRDLYDKYGLEGVKLGRDPNDNGFGLFNPFESHFKGPKKCPPKLIEINITLEQAITGVEIQRQVTRLRICKDCEGIGGTDPVECQKCAGKGFVEMLVMIGPGMMSKAPAPCDFCLGQGGIFEQQKRCKSCIGKKVMEDTKEFKVSVEAGVPNENDYKIEHEADERTGFESGDLYFRVKISPHERFQRRGADLYMNKRIPLLQALSGVTYTEHLLNNEEILISSTPFQIISNEEKRVIKNKGMPFFKSPTSRGHLIITFQIEMPLHKQIEEKKYYRLAHLIKQPISHFRNIEGEVRTLEAYVEVEKGAGEEEREGQRVQCQPQ